ncbi:TetR/AcrR family transcriptional regulator [Isoptericola halotolerans]|uniref:DNA-binding transcriptional regulator YbjK n=1 Tax=Isoptericola halotolerans TaxID=300560 RepID=A0ABX2A7Z3_9MICO|nr:TetR/AcrR family transcriptional regulator [Isoptericola halotolerans]NOV98030.1 DNA-binding transcriptional regulator YbjK [Isoptericola halotolerans]
MAADPSRVNRVLDAGIEVIGTEGLRALTHRAVDAAAGLPNGSTSNLFRTREALLQAMTARLVEVELVGWERRAARDRPASPDMLATTLAATVQQLTGPLRTLSVARYALFTEAARDPALRREVERAGRRVAAIGQSWLAAIGSSRPAEHTAIVMAHLDGVVLRRLAFPGVPGADDVAAGLRLLLRSLVEPVHDG